MWPFCRHSIFRPFSYPCCTIIPCCLSLFLSGVLIRIDSPEMNVEYRMSVQEYEELTPYAGDLVENWGKAPGHLNSDGQNLLVFGCKFGNVFIGVQPTFGYEVRASSIFFLFICFVSFRWRWDFIFFSDWFSLVSNGVLNARVFQPVDTFGLQKWYSTCRRVCNCSH